MKSILLKATTAILLFTTASCKSSTQKDAAAHKEKAEKTMQENRPATDGEKTNLAATTVSPDIENIVGEWEQQYTYSDKNGNYTLEPEEKQPSDTRLGFNWFRFNSDGSCLRDKEVKFKSTYEIQEKGPAKELIIHDVHGYTITELTDKELILGADGIFIVFKRIR